MEAAGTDEGRAIFQPEEQREIGARDVISCAMARERFGNLDTRFGQRPVHPLPERPQRLAHRLVDGGAVARARRADVQPLALEGVGKIKQDRREHRDLH
jgi:hypothetical protein